MDTKKWIDRVFAVSLVLMGASSLILSITGLTGAALPDWAIRTLGIINLIALPVLVYSTVKSVQEKNKMRQSAEAKARRGGAKKKKGKKK
jgi:protein-S-isoprenylcysteine O-methyltransferase Ste14